MKKTFTSLMLGACIATGFTSMAQQRMTLHEEFTGENCGPCAATNPDFWALLNSGTNPTKIIHIAYMSPIPSAGQFYYQNQAQTDARASYYSVPFAPYGRYDGHVPNATASSPGHPGFFTQADIDAEYAIASPFTMSITSTWNAAYDAVDVAVTVTCVSSTGWTGGTPKLRLALAQTVDWPTPPGSNGETHFENVVRKMYPDVTGTTVPATWTNGESHTYNLTCAFPSYADKSTSPFFVAWVQDDAATNKDIAQAGKGTPLPGVPNDAAITAMTTPGFVCVADGPYSPTHTVTIKNTGTATMTTATIYYQADGGTWSSYDWSGSLAPAATTVVTMPTTTLTVAGAAYHSFKDSIGLVNMVADQNPGNNVKAEAYFTENLTQLSLPFTTSFESADLTKFWATDNNNNDGSWLNYAPTSGSPGHSGAAAMYFNCYSLPSGETEVLTLPEVTPANPSAIDFWVAYAQYNASSNDKLEVVYSTDCGSSWTSLWSQSGAAMATAAITTSAYIPTSAASYRMKSVDVSSVPASSIIGFRGTSNYGNIIWLDDVNVRTGTVVGINEVAAASSMSIFPNPANNEANLTFTLKNAAKVSIEVLDAVGRVVYTVPAEQMSAGANKVVIPVGSFANGVYNAVITSDNAKSSERFTVAK